MNWLKALVPKRKGEFGLDREVLKKVLEMEKKNGSLSNFILDGTRIYSILDDITKDLRKINSWQLESYQKSSVAIEIFLT